MHGRVEAEPAGIELRPASSAVASNDGLGDGLSMLTERLNLDPQQIGPDAGGAGSDEQLDNQRPTPAGLKRSATCLSLERPPVVSDDSDDIEDSDSEPRRPQLVRKKSGELVKPSLVKIPRVRSEPSTKSVHFKDHLVHVRRFSRLEHPSAVNFDVGDGDGDGDDWSGSELDDEDTDPETDDFSSNKLSNLVLEIPNLTPHKYADAPSENRPPVYLDSITLSQARSALLGSIFVRNMGFAKDVSLRLTADNWMSFNEIKCAWSSDIRKRDRQAGFDRFVFTIGMANIPAALLSGRPMFVCVRYKVNDQEYWDNNHGQNYTVLLIDQSAQRRQQRRTRRQSWVVPQNQPRPSRPSLDSEFDYSTLDSYNPCEAQSKYTSLLASISGLPMRSQTGSGISGSNGELKSRYSFHTAYNSPPHSKTGSQVQSAAVSPSSQTGTSRAKAERVFPSSGTEKGWDASSYEDLLSKYCFYGSEGSRNRQNPALKKESVLSL